MIMQKIPALLLVLSVLILALFVGVFIFYQRSLACRNFKRGSVQVDGHEISIALAATDAERSKGLSGCTKLPAGSGMYFEFTDKQHPAFWMKDMLIPIDIIWIADSTIIGITADVQAPAVNMTGDLPLYYPPQPIDAVLEVNAGAAQQLGLSPGAAISVNY